MDESVKLQSHYASLLNMYDGCQRIAFASANDWIERLRRIGKLSSPSSAPAATPAKSKAFEEGRKAWPAMKLIDNPYDERGETVESEAWKNGWLSAHYANPKASPRVSAATLEVNDGRCESVMPASGDFPGERCGLLKGHNGAHTVLLSSDLNWVRAQRDVAEEKLRVSAATPAPEEVIEIDEDGKVTYPAASQPARTEETMTLAEQLCKDLNQAHDELLKAQGVSNPADFDWPEWSPQANSIRWAERVLGKRLAKTNIWTLFPEPAPPGPVAQE